MNSIYVFFILFWGGVGLAAAVAGFFAAAVKNKTFEETRWLLPWGIFVWGDAPIIGSFWFLVSLATGLMGDPALFGLIFCLFWVVRSVGETMYWINQQFSSINRNPPERLIGYKWFGNESVWFMYQIMYQMLTVIFLVGAIYFAHEWLVGLRTN